MSVLDKRESHKSVNYILEKEININGILDSVRKLQKEGKEAEALFLLEIIILQINNFINPKLIHKDNKINKSNINTDLPNKIIAYTIQSFIAVKVNNLNTLRKIANDFIIKYSELYFNNDNLELEYENYYLKVLYRTGIEESKCCLLKSKALNISKLLASELNYISTMMYWKANNFAKNIIDDISRNKLVNEINSLYINSLEEVSANVNINIIINNSNNIYTIYSLKLKQTILEKILLNLKIYKQ